MAALVDTNILVYRFDPCLPERQRIATKIPRHGIREDSLRLPRQAVVEFVSATTRSRRNERPLLEGADTRREAEELLDQFTVPFPNEAIPRTALRGAAAYRLPRSDAHLWAYAEHHALREILSEDFEHGRRYGTVMVTNPFV